MYFNNDFYAKLNDSIYSELEQVKDIQYLEENNSIFLVLRCVNESSEYSLRYCLDNILNNRIPETEFNSAMDSIIEDLGVEVANASDSDITSDIENFDRIKYRLAFTVISKDNKHALQDIPYLEYLDMCVYFYVLVNRSKDKIVRLDVSKELLSVWGVDVNKVMYHAIRNMERLLPVNFTVMQDNSEFDSEFLALGVSPIHKANIYVLTNQYMVHGASVLLYPDVLKSIAERLNDDLVIIPVSVHLCFILESRYFEESRLYQRLSELLDMIKYLEREEEYLSGNLYIYSRLSGKLNILRRFYEKDNC